MHDTMNPHGNAGNHGAIAPSVVKCHDFTAAEPVSTTVIDAVMAALDKEQTEISPLYHCIDLDALDALFTAPRDAPPSADGCVSFRYDDLEIRVYTTGVVSVRSLSNQ